MENVKGYWQDSKQRAKVAKEHTRRMQDIYSEDIKNSVQNTTLHHLTVESSATDSSIQTKIIVDDIDSVSAIYKYQEGKTAVLNFSSYKEAGGMFLNGSKAQEECLCHESFLYNVLSQFKESFYKENCKQKNRALYLNRALYSPGICFEKIVFSDGIKNQVQVTACDVITCASPNKTAAQTYCFVSNEVNRKTLMERIKFVLDIAAFHGVETLILGAYGCGVFGQDPKEVAEIFKEFLSVQKNFKTVIFAIPNGNNGNYSSFLSVMQEGE